MKKTLFMLTIVLFSSYSIAQSQSMEFDHSNDKTIMAIFAHADDEMTVLPILSKYATEGVNIYLVIVTDGSKGVKAHANIPAGDSLAKVRSEEALCLTATLGINPPILLNYVDGDLALGDNVYSLDNKIDSLFKKYQPDVILTWGPDGGYGNPDHRIVNSIVTEVFQSEGSRTIQQLLYVGFLKESLDMAPKLNTGPVNWLKENLKTTQKKFLTYRIPIEEKDFKLAREALGCYKSQLFPEYMDEIFLLLGQTEGLIYLRPWNGSAVVKDDIFESIKNNKSSRIETFTFPSNGTTTKGKIYLPSSYETNKNLPAIFLIDYTEQHFKLATDEFEKVIDGVQQIDGFDALVVTLENIPDIDAEPETFKNHYEVYKNMTSYVDANYTNNSSRTFIGKGSESGVVLMALFLESSEKSVFDNFIVTDPSPKYASAIINLIEKDNIPKTRLNKKLHFSFSTSNDRAKCTKLINLIKEAQYQWLQFESIEYTNSDYENTYPISYAAGIKYVFNK